MEKNAGFSLLELIISITILVILAELATASYQSYLKRANAEVAAQVLLKDAQFMEKYYSQNGSYSNGSAWPSLPYRLAPESGPSLYRIKLLPTIANGTSANAYSLIAVPLCSGLMAGSLCVCVDQDGNINLNGNSACNNGALDCRCTN